MGDIITYDKVSGSTVTFETDVAKDIKKLEVDIKPVQDLHGYDSPWPAWGGKNLFDPRKIPSTSDQTCTLIDDGFILTATAGGSYKSVAFSVEGNYAGKIVYLKGNVVSSGDNNGYISVRPYNENGVEITPQQRCEIGATRPSHHITMPEGTAYLRVVCYSTFNKTAASGDSATFTNVILSLSDVSYSPYSNICPITGWTGAKVTRTGKNLLPPEGFNETLNGVTISSNDGVYTLSGNATSYAQFVSATSFSLKKGTYTLFWKKSVSDTRTRAQLRSVDGLTTYASSYGNPVTFTFSENTEVKFRVATDVGNANEVTLRPQLELGSTVTEYKPYQGNIYDITFPSAAGTVYGGTLDVVKGELLVNMKSVVFDGTQQIDLYSSGDNKLPIYYPETVTLTDGKIVSSISRKASNYSDLMSNINTARLTQNGIVFHFEGFKGQSWTPSDFNAYCKNLYDNDTPFQICYELATPIVYQLTPQQIQTIIGTNTVYADAGDVTVYYPKSFVPVETMSNMSLLSIRRNIISTMKPTITNKVYGVEWNYADPSTVLKRTGAAANFANPIPAESLNEVGWSPFDNVYPWSEMKRYNIINGEVAYSEDDAGYSETAYDTMVYIPEFYYYAYKDTANQKWYWSISGTPLEGYEKHPGSGRYVGRFHTSGSSSGVYSKSDASPLASISRANFRTYSHNKGAKWWQIDLATWSAIQLLYLVEFANWNSQSVLGLGNNNGEYPENTGETNGLLYHSIKRSDSANAYRSIENPFSNILIFIDGIVAYNKRIYTTTNISNYSESYSTMQNTNISLPNIGFIKNIGYSSICPFAFIPNESFDGDGSTYVSDMVESGNVNTNHIAAVGGHWNQLPKRGLFFIACASEASIAHHTLGSRLMFIPSN